jgi:hypothetical protein
MRTKELMETAISSESAISAFAEMDILNEIHQKMTVGSGAITVEVDFLSQDTGEPHR